MLSADELRQMDQFDGSSMNKDALVDIRTIKIDTELSKEERIADFIRQIKNPYLFRCGDMVVESVFSDTEITLTDRLKQYFQTV